MVLLLTLFLKLLVNNLTTFKFSEKKTIYAYNSVETNVQRIYIEGWRTEEKNNKSVRTGNLILFLQIPLAVWDAIA